MNLKYILLAIALFVVGAASCLVFVRQSVRNQPEPAYHEHADFALFLNGQRFDFAKDTYMNVKPCIVQAEQGIPFALAHGGEDLSDAVHLHDMDGEVVHVHRQGITWHQFFESLKMDFSDVGFVDETGQATLNDEKNTFRFFVNGEEVETLAQREIRDLDEVLITYGAKNRGAESIAVELAAVSNKACQSSGSCSHRGSTAVESCNADEAKPSTLLQWLGL